MNKCTVKNDRDPSNPPPCPQALLEWTDVGKLFLEGLLSCLKGPPPRRVANTRKHLQTLFRLFFWCRKIKPTSSKTGALATLKSPRKPEKWGPEWNVEKIGKKHWKIEALEPWKSWFRSEGLQKNYFDLAPKNSRNGVENNLKIA